MPRSYADYPEAYAGLNMMSSIGAYLAMAGFVVFFIAVIQQFARKEKAAANPWGPGATSLEWTLPSPPPFHTFDTLPRIK